MSMHTLTILRPSVLGKRLHHAEIFICIGSATMCLHLSQQVPSDGQIVSLILTLKRIELNLGLAARRGDIEELGGTLE